MVHVDIKAEQLFAIGPLIVTNSMVGALLASIILLLAARWFVHRSDIVPSRAQSLLELPIEFLAGIVRGTGGKRWRQFAPLIFGIFLFVLIAEPAYMTPLLTPIHLISELSRVISLSMRLFGNVFAGEVLLATMLALTTATIFILPLAFVVPGIFIGLELLIGLVQALVFALLSMTYITLAIAEHREHDSGDHHSGETPEPATAPAPGAV